MPGVYGPARLPLGHPVTTRLIDRLWREDVDARAIRIQNEAIILQHVRETLMSDTESAWPVDSHEVAR